MGHDTDVYLFAWGSFVQATAAAQAGVSVIQPNIGRVDDWFHKYPGVIRDPKVAAHNSPGRFGPI